MMYVTGQSPNKMYYIVKTENIELNKKEDHIFIELVESSYDKRDFFRTHKTDTTLLAIFELDDYDNAYAFARERLLSKDYEGGLRLDHALFPDYDDELED